MPTRLAPAQLGDLTFKREPSAEKKYRAAGSDALVSDGRIYSIHAGDVIEGSLQISLFNSKVDTADINDESRVAHCTDNPLDCTGHEAFKGIQSSIGTGPFHRVYVDGLRTYEMELSDQRIYCWFPRGTETMALLILRQKFTASASNKLRDALIVFQQGREPSPFVIPPEPAAPPPSAPPSEISASPGPGVGSTPTPNP
jgi:hypothetical protein